MRPSFVSRALTLVSLVKLAVAGDIYTLSDIIAIPDPTHGRVNYVDSATAQRLGLAFATANSFVMRADDTTVLSPTGPGRNSVRIRSNNEYTTHVAVFDINHMPEGCGTWPAVWETLEADWPDSGEIDIIEGVNNMSPNQVHLHTSPNCSIPSNIEQLGTVLTTDCDATVNYNSGCGSTLSYAPNSFGPAFNAAGGGWYALERTDDYISVWFWDRNNWLTPVDVRLGSPIVDTSLWGMPAAYFPNTDCDLASHFGPNNIIIDLTFCGDWAGSATVYNASGLPFYLYYVNNNPRAFKNAYFQFASIKVYE
ncbi:glycoside hydrolase family 16 protein [Pisolithus marmoratus]|nr:glycoside hydrolase family 16 protein [Pisolithus marmoratus]